MESSIEVQARSQSDNDLDGWREFFKANCAALFQTALLLTADPEEAEATVIGAIDSLDVSVSPDWTALAAVQESVARQTMLIRTPRDPSKLSAAQVMLPNELRPILQIDPSSRVCFVLRMLLGYATSSCARMMGVEEAAVKTLLRIAILQLHIAVCGFRRSGWTIPTRCG